jgi:hypothetical protein
MASAPYESQVYEKSLNQSDLKPRSAPGGAIFDELLLSESVGLRKSTLAYQVVGRALFVAIILAEYFGRSSITHPIRIVFPIVWLALIWSLGSLTASYRTRFISRIIAESVYRDDPERGQLFIFSYHDRYEGLWGRIRDTIIGIEPIVWASLAIWPLF